MASTLPWHESSRAVRVELSRAIDRERLKALHRVSGWRHAALALRQLLVLAAAVAVVLRWGDRWWAWVPASVVVGFVVFSATVLLHEVVHRTVFASHASPWNGVLGLVYGLVGGLAPAQFTRWHLDHHDWLGTADRDPKRHHLTPKVVRRWYKALYLTPALFPIYFRAAAREARTYEPALRARIRRERALTVLFHAGVFAALAATLGVATAAKLHLVPVLLVFPVAFTVNRLGQHYDVDPDDPAGWGTLMSRSPWWWDRVFLWSNYHLEHHYFPRVPCYRLPALRRELEPFLARHGLRPRTYAGLLADWFLRNRTPHTDWTA